MSDQTKRAEENLEKAENDGQSPTPGERKHDQIDEEKS